MLAIFNSAVAYGPEELRSPRGEISTSPDLKKNSSALLSSFLDAFPQSISVKMDEMATMAFTHSNQSLLHPRSFAVKDDCFCLFEGTLENLASLRQEYGLSKCVNEVLFVIEAYRTFRDRAPYPACKMVGHLEGQFAFVIFDRGTKTVFTAADSNGKVPLYWGITADGCLSFSGDAELLKAACGKSLASFPQGCFYSSASGLRSYEYPKNKVMGIPTMDGEMCGTTFKVEHENISASMV
uniref:DUF3700 domain-containing protein n=2 Tax=Picea sitchensis TaxID=3332 RepID=A9NXI3_PICSI|nr:unknown [Picea sitchensis]